VRCVVVKRIGEVLSSRPTSVLWARSIECMSTELSVDIDSWNSGDIFCVHYGFVLSAVSINTVKPRAYLLHYNPLLFQCLPCLRDPLTHAKSDACFANYLTMFSVTVAYRDSLHSKFQILCPFSITRFVKENLRGRDPVWQFVACWFFAARSR
jgi:hypothetical protein